MAPAADAIRMIRTVGSAIDEVRNQAWEKGKNAAKAVKAMSAFEGRAGEASSSALPKAVQSGKEQPLYAKSTVLRNLLDGSINNLQHAIQFPE